MWELLWWFVGGSCKKDSRYVRAKGQVLYASFLTVKSHLRQKLKRMSEKMGAQSLQTVYLEQKHVEIEARHKQEHSGATVVFVLFYLNVCLSRAQVCTSAPLRCLLCCSLKHSIGLCCSFIRLKHCINHSSDEGACRRLASHILSDVG